MIEINNFYHGNGLWCRLFFNDEPITIKEFDEISATFKSGGVMKFRNKKIRIMKLDENCCGLHKINFVGDVIEIE